MRVGLGVAAAVGVLAALGCAFGSRPEPGVAVPAPVPSEAPAAPPPAVVKPLEPVGPVGVPVAPAPRAVPADADRRTAYLLDCHAVFGPGQEDADNWPPTPDETECTWWPFYQNCAPDLSGCGSDAESCRTSCGRSCTSCDVACAAACDRCEAGTPPERYDDRWTCADARVECVMACLEARSGCFDGCSEAEDTCTTAARRDIEASCPSCETLSPCLAHPSEEPCASAEEKCLAWCGS